ncbi:MAG: SDR family oxidoreductase [Coprobacillus sp.]
MKKLKDKKILLTGGAGGVGFETALSLAEMGAYVIIVDIDQEKGLKTAKYINDLYPNSTAFYKTDLSIESDVIDMCEDIVAKHGCPDVVFNNATIAIIGSLEKVNLVEWDISYSVNLKAPIILSHYFLPYMKERGEGCFVFVSSSGAAPFMGAYETFKTAQVELSATLALELEGTNVYSYTIGPGLVKTETAQRSIEVIALQMGMSIEEFYAMNESHIIDVKEAGLGFALSVLNAKKYHGQEISSIQVINDFDTKEVSREEVLVVEKELLKRIILTFEDQYNGWKAMNIFERQWVFRDFKKIMGISADEVYSHFINIKQDLCGLDKSDIYLFDNLKKYWIHQYDLLQGFEKNKEKREDSSVIINGWIQDLDNLLISLK